MPALFLLWQVELWRVFLTGKGRLVGCRQCVKEVEVPFTAAKHKNKSGPEVRKTSETNSNKNEIIRKNIFLPLYWVYWLKLNKAAVWHPIVLMLFCSWYYYWIMLTQCIDSSFNKYKRTCRKSVKWSLRGMYFQSVLITQQSWSTSPSLS